MAKIVLDDTSSGYNLQKINANFQKIEDALNDQVLYRDNPPGNPNELKSDVDANQHRIFNLPAPTLDSEAARLKEVKDLIAGTSPASLIPFTPYLDITSTNVQGAIQEVKDDNEAEETRAILKENEIEGRALYRTNPGAKPNNMLIPLDMGNQQINNLAAPTLPADAARLLDVQNASSGLTPANLSAFAPYLYISSTNTQAAVQELVDDLAVQASGATRVGFAPYFWIPGTTVDAAIKGVADGLSSTAGASRVGYSNGQAGAVLRTVSDRLRDVKTVKDFGAIGNGIADDTAAIQAAVNWAAASFSGKLHFPAGSYKTTSAITMDGANARVVIYGDGEQNTFINANHNGNGFLFGFTTPVPCAEFYDMTINTNTISSGAAIWVKGSGSQPKSFKAARLTMYGASVGGTPSAGYWAAGAILLTNPTYPIIEDCSFFGIGGTPSIANNNLIFSGYTIVSNDAKGSFFVNFRNCFANGCNNAFYARSDAAPGVEGLYMTRCNTVATNVGFHAESTVGSYFPPQYNINNSQFEFMQRGNNFLHVSEVICSNNLYYADPTGNNAIQGIQFQNCIDSQVHHGKIEARPIHTNMRGVDFSGTCNIGQVDAVLISTPMPAVAIFNASNNIWAYGNRNLGVGGVYFDGSSAPATNKLGMAAIPS